jgi:lactate dehydrogenase-like 2-hydroxyacid dehydrogenase
MTFHIGLVGPTDQSFTDALRRHYTVHALWESAGEKSSQGFPSDLTAIVTDGRHGASAGLIGSLPNLRLIACFGVGVDAIALDIARQRGVSITTTPDVLTDDVADMAVALLLAVSRQVVVGHEYVRSGRWGHEPMTLGRRVSGKSAGIVGLGHIGRAVAARLTAFGMRVAYSGRRKTTDAYDFYSSLASLARDVQFLIVTASGGAATRGIVDKTVLEALGPEGVLINVARGSVVDQSALVEALLNGRIAGAGLDVFADEPTVPDDLKAMRHVVLQPHQGSATIEGRQAMASLVMRNLEAHFAGKPLVSPYE